MWCCGDTAGRGHDAVPWLPALALGLWMAPALPLRLLVPLIGCSAALALAPPTRVVQHVPPGDFTRWLQMHAPLKPHTRSPLAPPAAAVRPCPQSLSLSASPSLLHTSLSLVNSLCLCFASLVLDAGDHLLSETLKLGASATGLRISADTAGARLTGGYRVPSSAWNTQGSIWRASLPAGSWSAGSDPPRQLWTGGGRSRRTRARHPNLWNHDVTAVEEAPYLYWSSPLTNSFGGAHCTAHSCQPPCVNSTGCDAAVRENRYGFRYNQTADGELMAMLASADGCGAQGGDCGAHTCTHTHTHTHTHTRAHTHARAHAAHTLTLRLSAGGLEAVVYHGWTVSRSFVASIFPAGHSVHLRNPADRPIGFWSGLSLALSLSL